METKLRKVLILIIIFMMMFSNFGFTIKAIATSDEFQVISNGFFRKDEVKFSGYFENEDGKQTNEVLNNAKQRAILKFNIKPQVEGYLKNANIKAVATDGTDLNFRFVSAKNMLDEINQEEEKEDTQFEVKNENKDLSEISAMNEIENTSLENSVNENQASNVINEISNDANEISNSVSKELNSNTVENSIANEISNNTVSNDVPLEEEEEFIDEEEYIKQEQETETEVEKEKLVSDIKLINDNEISLVNILEDTTLEVVIEFNQKDEINIADLYKEISFRLTGTYINVKLEEVDIAKEQLMNIGWKYSKDIEVTSEYTKFSPFKIGEVTGIIAENKIVLARNIEDSKYLPIKNTNIEIMVPTVNGKMPMSVDVQATKLMATKGQDSGYVEFTNNNWIYDQNEGKIIINVNNDIAGKAKNSLGEDEYVIIYRFDEYTENETVRLDRDVKVTVEEYSAKENSILEKTIDDNVEIQTNKGELITYSISSSEEKINKAKIYANYNSPDAPYETEYTSNIRLNVLTSDMLEELKIDSSKEYFIDKNGTELEASGIKYKKMTFNYNDIKSTLEKGGAVEIYSLEGALIYTLTKDLVKSQDDCTINMNNEPGVIIQVRDVSANGKIDVEITKAIGRPEIDKSIFANFRRIESRITAEVKYANIEERLTLPLIGTSKEFEESYTKATLSINKPNLTTMQENENVELKIELNNDSQKSDLYVNPTFELVYPKHIKEVELESINVIYDSGLTVKHFETYRDGENLKTRIELDGIQTSFIENSMTNGTNIILNARMKIDEYTPRKEDQIKLYYYNEGVSNYQTQTMWKVNKTIPNNILKQTNGFDVALINYQAPVGLIAINGMRNYDGEGSELRSVKQGTMTRQIQRERAEVNTTMDLLVLNNTGNECSDITMLGRVPFKGNKDVITGENLGTNIDVRLVGSIQEDSENSAKATIYYSAKADANKNLNDASNGWTTDVQDMSKVKSYLIVVDGKVEPGAFLKYTYGFVIPENLPYEGKIVGSFGAYYNNITDVAVVYESMNADKTVLETEKGAKLEARLNVDIGDGADILEERRMMYTVTVINSGSVPISDITITNPVPRYTYYTEKGPVRYGDYGFEVKDEKEIKETGITLEPGATKEMTYYLTAQKIPNLSSYCASMGNSGEDENGVYYEKVVGTEIEKIPNTYVDENGVEHTEYQEVIKDKIEKVYVSEVPDVYIENKATIETPLIADKIETNTVRNRMKKANFSSSLAIDYDRLLVKGSVTNYQLTLRNISGRDLENAQAIFNIGEGLVFVKGEVQGTDITADYNQETHKISYDIGKLDKDSSVTISTEVQTNSVDEGRKQINCYFELKADDVATEYSTVIPQYIVKPKLSVEDMTAIKNTYGEEEVFTVTTKITNVGADSCKNATIECEIPNAVTIRSVKVSGDSNGTLDANISTGKLESKLPLIPPDRSIIVDINFKTQNLAGSDPSKVILTRIIKNENQTDIKMNPVELTVENNLKTMEEKEKEREEERKQEEEKNKEDKKDQTDNTQNNNQNTNNSNNNNSNNNSNNNNNSTNNNSNNNNNNNTNNNNSNNNTPTVQEEKTYMIKGVAWLDKNADGVKDENEEKLKNIKVYLLDAKTNAMIKSAMTNSNGEYQFSDLKNGRYIVGFEFDMDKYKITSYKKSGVSEELNSDVTEAANARGTKETIKAVTNEITINNADVSNVNIGLKDAKQFDIEINKYLSKATVINKKEKKEYKYDKADIAKLEIHSKQINNSTVKLEYDIVVKNIGNLEGTVQKIVDSFSSDVEFDEKDNKDWYKGNDGKIYSKNQDGLTLKPGEEKILKLVVTKKLDGNSTGSLSNKAILEQTNSSSGEEEETKNNTSTQITIITVSTGGRTITTILIAIFGIAVIGFMYISPKVNINLGDIGKKSYKAKKETLKKKLKKIYK